MQGLPGIDNITCPLIEPPPVRLVDIHTDLDQRDEKPSRKALQLAAAAHRIDAREDDIDVAQFRRNLGPSRQPLGDLGGGIHRLANPLRDIDFGVPDLDVRFQ